MGQTFRAIYEQGILRPLAPLDLPESAVVECTPVEQPCSAGGNGESDDVIATQRKALQALLEEIGKIPQTPVNDGLHGRDHDEILYGKPS